MEISTTKKSRKYQQEKSRKNQQEKSRIVLKKIWTTRLLYHFPPNISCIPTITPKSPKKEVIVDSI